MKNGMEEHVLSVNTDQEFAQPENLIREHSVCLLLMQTENKTGCSKGGQLLKVKKLHPKEQYLSERVDPLFERVS